MEKIKLGISACLLGEEVRYDGGHKLDRFLRDTLGMFVEYYPVCPEVECGLPVPRESMRLEGDPLSPRLVATRSRRDLTGQMLAWIGPKLDAIEKEELCGFIFKANSPSSGMDHVKVYDENAIPRKAGRGMFAGAFIDRFPLLPVEDDGRLHDPGIRESFIERVFVFRRWRDVVAGGKKRADLIDFQARHKLLVMAHSPRHATLLGKLAAGSGAADAGDPFARYGEILMEALKLKATAAKHTNVLQHIMGYFKKQLSSDEKQELLEVIDIYRRGDLPLIVPVTLVCHYVRKFDQAYLKGQHYLHPHPLELRLRNHV
jgi:uncharacterized protein YbgA (DUF1722 family)/uncharacterized protein YbbK (DUF523 family)